MNLDIELALPEIAMLCGVDQNVLRNWMASGLLSPVRRGGKRGKGRSLTFDLRSLVIVGLLRDLRRRGTTLQFAMPLAKFLSRMTPRELDEAAAKDMIIVYIPGALPPCLCEQNETFEYRGNFPTVAFKSSVKSLWEIIANGLASRDKVMRSPLENLVMASPVT